MDKRDRSGFTLIELLTVVAVITIIAAFLFPVFAQAREKARQSSCISNLKQIAAAMLMYSEENDLLFPPVLVNSGSGSPLYPMTWVCRLQPYVRSSSVFIDPSSGHTSTNWHASGDLLRNYSYAPPERTPRRQAQWVIAAP